MSTTLSDAPQVFITGGLLSSVNAGGTVTMTHAIVETPTTVPVKLAPISHGGMPQAGDLLFYVGHGSLASRLIQWWTRGPYVHVEIAVSPTEAIGALTTGIDAHSTKPGYVLLPTSRVLASRALADGLEWLSRQKGHAYGWPDIGDDVMARVFPKHGLFLVDPHAFDCSHLAADFLLHADYPHAADLFPDPEIVTPNSLMCALVA